MPDSNSNPFRRKPESSDEYLERMWDRIEQISTVQLPELLKEQQRTNGRVTELEKWRTQMERDMAAKTRETEAYERGWTEANRSKQEAPLLTRKHAIAALVAVLAAGAVAGSLSDIFNILSGQIR